MKPITREEMYLAAAAGYDVTPPEPVTRKEMFLAKLAGMEVETPAVFTRQERFLEEAAARAPSVTINNQDITVTENGQYTADEGYTGLGTVTVEVPDEPAVLEDLKVTENGNYTPSKGVDGFGSVSVNVPDIPAVVQPLEITENGTYTAPDGVDGYSPVTVNVPAPEVLLQDKTITENGTYTADSGFDGLGSVEVNVKGGGGGLTIGAYWGAPSFVNSNKNSQVYAVYNGELLAFTSTSTTGSSAYNIYKYNGTTFTQVHTQSSMIPSGDLKEMYTVEHNGKLHIFRPLANTHGTWDGASVATLSNLPYSAGWRVFVQDGKLKLFNASDWKVYAWNETTDTWTAESARLSGLSNMYLWVCNIGGTVYAINNKDVYEYKNSTLTLLFTIDVSLYSTDRFYCVYAGKAYILDTYSGNFYCLDFDAKTLKEIGRCNGTHLFVYNNALHSIHFRSGMNGSLAMHEVTE